MTLIRPTIPPPRRGLSREEAAIYVGVSPSYFDTLVQRGQMPQPKHIGARRVWDVRELDLAFDGIAANNGQEDTWADR